MFKKEFFYILSIIFIPTKSYLILILIGKVFLLINLPWIWFDWFWSWRISLSGAALDLLLVGLRTLNEESTTGLQLDYRSSILQIQR